MSWLADAAVWAALLVSSGLALALRRRVKHLGHELVAFRSALADLDATLAAADGAVRALVEEGGALAATLADRIAEVRSLNRDKAA